MEHMNFPHRKVWDERCDWFDDALGKRQGYGGYDVSDQAAALTSELRAVYCCGAWYTVIILSVSIIDVTLREIDMPDHKGNTADLAAQLHFNPDFDWLRKKRNKLVHIDVNNPAASLDGYSDELEADAKRAVEIVFDALCNSPGT